MGTRVTFRPRARGCAAAGAGSPAGASYLEPRVKFVRGVKTPPSAGEVECGSGTLFPMKVTVDEFFELFYRVKDARFNSGLAHSVSYGFATGELNVTSPTPSTLFFDSTTEDPSGPDEQTIVVERSYTQGSPAANLTDEVEMWNTTHNIPTFDLNIADGSHITGFSHLAQLTIPAYFSSSIPLVYSPYMTVDGGSDIWPALIELGFSGYVAVFDADSDGDYDPFNSGNELWVGLEFWSFAWDDAGGGGGMVDVYASAYDDGSGAEISGVTLSFALNSGTPSCALFGRSSGVTHGGSGYTLTATEWWEYAHPNGSKVWNATTGAYTPPTP